MEASAELPRHQRHRTGAVLQRRPGARTAMLVASLLIAGAATAASPQHGILDDPTRPPDDVTRDAGSRPLELYEFLGIAAGQTVLDAVPAAGYNTHLLSRLVGESGHVLATYIGEQGAANLIQRATDAGLANVAVHASAADIPDASVDTVVAVQNWHDLYTPGVLDAFGMTMEGIHADLLRVLKPGGVFGVVDVRTPMSPIDADAHRINEDFLVREIEAAGFELVERSDILGSPDDDHSIPRFDARWDTDRFVLKFRKPR